MEYAAIAFRVVVGSIFVLAAIAKLPRRRAFEAAVASYAIGLAAAGLVVEAVRVRRAILAPPRRSF